MSKKDMNLMTKERTKSFRQAIATNPVFKLPVFKSLFDLKENSLFSESFNKIYLYIIILVGAPLQNGNDL